MGNVPILFLVLEVFKKWEYVDLSCTQCPAKVLLLLNEKTRDEWAMCLRYKWLYAAMIDPGMILN